MILVFFALFIIILLVGVAKVARQHWEFLSETDAVSVDARLFGWLVKGVVTPFLVWIAFTYSINGGRLPPIPRLIATVLALPKWVVILFQFVLPAVVVVGSYWAAITAAWLVVHLVARTEGRREIRGTSIFWGVVLSPVVAFILYALGWFGLGFALLVLLVPIARELTAFGAPKQIAPVYARAMDQVNFGDPKKAEIEVLRQLERKEDDYDGWMLLAELYANKFGDLGEAERTVREIGRHPKTTKDQYCRALHRLSDWHLTVGKNPATARAILEEICRAYPHSSVSDIARRRIEQIPLAASASDAQAEPDNPPTPAV